MDLQELAERTQIPIRRLRHCLDEDLVPGLRIAISPNETGRPRKFHDDVGYAICCAARLVEAGMNRSRVRRFMEGLAQLTLPGDKKPAICYFIERQAQGRAEMGDNLNMRIQLDLAGLEKPLDTGWVHPGNPACLAPGYRPLTTIGLDLGQIGEQVFGRPKPS